MRREGRYKRVRESVGGMVSVFLSECRRSRQAEGYNCSDPSSGMGRGFAPEKQGGHKSGMKAFGAKREKTGNKENMVGYFQKAKDVTH